MSFDKVLEMCEAIDKYSKMPFLHILVDDNSYEMPPLNFSPNKREWILLRYTNKKVHDNIARAWQVALDYASHKYSEQKALPEFENVFIVESDVVVCDGWDEKLILASKKLKDWATINPISVHPETGIITYPTKVIRTIGKKIGEFSELKYPEYNAILFSQEALKSDWKFTDFASHQSILAAYAIKEKKKLKFYRYDDMKVIHHVAQSYKLA